MRSNGFRLGFSLRTATYGTLGLLFVSGALWWALQRWGRVETEFGSAVHPLTPWLLRIHGAAAMLVLVVLGWLIPVHVLRGWRARKNRMSGAGMVTILGALSLTGWLLYYASDDRLRAAASGLHLWLGFGLPWFICFHVWRGRRSRRQKQPSED